MNICAYSIGLVFVHLMAIASHTMGSPYAFYGGAHDLRSMPTSHSYSYGVHSAALVTPTQQQYHAQDDLGQYAYGYSEPLSSKQEVRSLDGITRGSYSYRDAEGKVQTVAYTADANGFHVAATNLPRSAASLAVDQTQPFLVAGTTVAATNTANVADAADATDTALIDASHRIQSPTATAAISAIAETSGVRVAGTHSATGKSGTVDPIDSAVELPNTVDDTVGVAASVDAPAAFYHRSLPPTMVYRPAVVLPKVYAYKFNLQPNVRLLPRLYF